MALDKRYIAVATPPPEALKTISAGKLKGFFDINPQWRLEAMTSLYGLCGEGWRYSIYHTEQVQCPEGELLLFMIVEVAVRLGDGEWSQSIYGCGSSYIIQNTKNGLQSNPEAMKMALTDSLSNALKALGVAADVYKGSMDGAKYTRDSSTENALLASARPVGTANVDNICSECNAPVSEKVAAFSRRKYARCLCMSCQASNAA